MTEAPLVIQLFFVSNHEEILKLVETYKKTILETNHFDDFDIKKQFKEKCSLIEMCLYPKSPDDWFQYTHCDLPATNNWFEKNFNSFVLFTKQNYPVFLN